MRTVQMLKTSLAISTRVGYTGTVGTDIRPKIFNIAMWTCYHFEWLSTR